MGNQKFKIISALSKIDWVGKKVTGAHNGTIAVKEGELILNEDKLTGGKITVDIASIKVLDITDPATNAQFAGHLASDDFFSAEKYPQAILEIISVSGQHVEGSLTIKGISHPIGFDVVLNIDRDTLTATGKLVIDRTKYGMKFRSGNFFKDLGDNLIYDEFELNISVTAKTAWW
ncbi:MAG TPA: YceI family protein [Puia sp.]|jgi:polyisoprenoid-binding protein YceI|nr:YceI family protein [Puia sp.]